MAGVSASAEVSLLGVLGVLGAETVQRVGGLFGFAGFLIGGEGFFEGFWGDGFIVEDDGNGHVGFGGGVWVAFREFEVSEKDACFTVEGAFGLEADGFVEGFSCGLFVAGGDEGAAFDEETFCANWGFLGFLEEVFDGLNGWAVVAGLDLGLSEEVPVSGADVFVFGEEFEGFLSVLEVFLIEELGSDPAEDIGGNFSFSFCFVVVDALEGGVGVLLVVGAEHELHAVFFEEAVAVEFAGFCEVGGGGFVIFGLERGATDVVVCFAGEGGFRVFFEEGVVPFHHAFEVIGFAAHEGEQANGAFAFFGFWMFLDEEGVGFFGFDFFPGTLEGFGVPDEGVENEAVLRLAGDEGAGGGDDFFVVVGASGAIGEADEGVAEFVAFEDVDFDDVAVGGECGGEVFFGAEKLGLHAERGEAVVLVAMGCEEGVDFFGGFWVIGAVEAAEAFEGGFFGGGRFWGGAEDAVVDGEGFGVFVELAVGVCDEHERLGNFGGVE